MTDLAWETLDTTTDYSCPGFDVLKDDVRLPDGIETDFHYLSEPDSVVVLPFTADDEVVLIEEWRQAVKRVNRGLPAGGLEPDDDDLAAAAHRELAEETGYEADSVEKLVSVEPANGMIDTAFHYYVAYDCTPTGEQNLDANETIRVTTTTWDDLLTACKRGAVRDGRTVTGVLQYALAE